jgi:hypothetical protein
MGQSELLFTAPLQHGVKSRLQVYPGYTHGDFRFNIGARLARLKLFWISFAQHNAGGGVAK